MQLPRAGRKRPDRRLLPTSNRNTDSETRGANTRVLTPRLFVPRSFALPRPTVRNGPGRYLTEMISTALATKTVVIAGTTASVRDRFRTAIEGAGHRAVAVRSAAELLARVRSELPRLDLIVLDLRLPPGIELVRGVRRMDDGRLPILVFSGTIANADEVRELASLGVSGYVNEHSDACHILPALAPYLFPDSFNRRHSPRVTVGIPVAYRFGQTVAAATTLNLGKGGLAIRTMSPLGPNSRARVRFRLQGTGREVDAEARVVWSDSRMGMGLEFQRIDPADQAAVDAYVDSHFFGTRQGGRGTR